jgi:hypothetical protein
MATEEIVLAAGVASAAFVAQQLFGKTLAEMGDDLNKVYKSNRDKLLAKAAARVADPNDGAKPNLRVARDVIWNGAVTDDEVCAEYFGGLLAASRSADGKDDSTLIYVDCIKALSSKQLHLHFVIYSGLQSVLLRSGRTINPGLDTELTGLEACFATNQLTALGLNPHIDLNILHRQGLVNAYSMNSHAVGDKALPYAKANPTTFGVLLYAASLNSLRIWTSFGQVAFAQTSEIPIPALCAQSLEELCVLAGLVPQQAVVEATATPGGS